MKKTKRVQSIEGYIIPYATAVYGQEEIDAVLAVLKGRWLGRYKLTWEFEKKMAELFGKKYGLFVNSGSSANLLALSLFKFPKDSEVITPACTFGTTLSPIVYAGLRPVFVDSEVGNYNAKIEEIEAAIGPKTVAIMLPDTTGMLNDWPRLQKIAKKNNVKLIQDSCDTQGAKIKGKPHGSWSDVTTTSSYFTHTITTGGVGGTVMLNDKDLRKRAEVMATWGRRMIGYNEDIKKRFSQKLNGVPYDGKFIYDELGYNFGATEMQAAFGLAQLAKIDHFNELRRNVTVKLMNFFQGHEEHFILPKFLPNTEHSLLAFPITIRETSPIVRKNLMEYLEGNKIQTRLLFAGNALYHPAFKNIQYRKIGKLAGADTILKSTFLVPNHHALVDKQLDYLFSTFTAYFKRV